MLLAELVEDAIMAAIQEGGEALSGLDVFPVDVDLNHRWMVDRCMAARFKYVRQIVPIEEQVAALRPHNSIKYPTERHRC